MTGFDFEAQKKQFVQKLEAVEKIRLDFDNLKTKLKSLDIGGLIEQAAQSEIATIMRYAKKHDIPFTIDVADLVNQVQLPSLNLAPSNLQPIQILPFVPASYNSITDEDGDEWTWNATSKQWVLEEDEWNDSGCEWSSSSQNC